MKILTDNSLAIQIKYIKRYVSNVIKRYISVFGGDIAGTLLFKSPDESKTFIRYKNMPAGGELQFGCGDPGDANENWYQDGAKFKLGVNNDVGYYTIDAIQDSEHYASLVSQPNKLIWNHQPLIMNKNVVDLSSRVTALSTITLGSWSSFFQVGPVVFVGINISNVISVASATVILSGLPIPVAKFGGALHSETAGIGLRVYVDLDGTVKLDGASSATAGWVNGSITYFTEDMSAYENSV